VLDGEAPVGDISRIEHLPSQQRFLYGIEEKKHITIVYYLHKSRMILTTSMNRDRKKCKWYDLCPVKHYYEAGLIERTWVLDYCFGAYKSCVRYLMEEAGETHPDWMMPDGSVDERLRGA
jgi:hypothetical protein